MTRRRTFLKGLAVAGMLLPLTSLAFPLSDDFESGSGAWSLSGTWGLSTAHSFSPVHALTDSPDHDYSNGVYAAAALAANLDLSAAVAPAISFYHRYHLETDYDYATLEVSSDGGSSYAPVPLLRFTGQQSNWTRQQADLDAYIGQNDVRLRFKLISDDSVVMDGWYIDDVSIGDRPAPVVLQSLASANKVELTWSVSTAPDFAVYRVYRSMSSNVNWHTARLLKELTLQSGSNYTDVTAAPKTRYYYRVMVLNAENLHVMSNETAPLTPAGSDYPFLDDGEGGAGRWTLSGPWALSEETAFSLTHAWSDSPGSNYANAVNNDLRLAAPLDLSTAVNPVLSFVHTNAFVAGDSGSAEVSLNGLDWDNMKTATGQSADWQRERFDLSAYAGQPALYLRFRISTDPANTADGWHVDDISVAESPSVIDGPVISEVQSHSMRLSWTASTFERFSHYAVFRDTSAAVDFNSVRVATLYDRATSTCLATELALDTEHFFRVYAVSIYGTYSPSGTESHERTLNHPFPFSENFEGSLEGWNLTGNWDADVSMAHTGTVSLGDSPGLFYGHSSDSYAQTAVDLSGSIWPVLRFWDRYQIAAGDSGFVEVSINGTSWDRRYAVTEGDRTTWGQQTIDLSEWKHADNLRIRFRLASDYNPATTAGGWNIDDVEVVDYSPPAASYPFFESYESGASNWLNSTWTPTIENPYEGSQAYLNKPTRAMIEYLSLMSTLGLGLDLTGAVAPQLTYWLRGQIDNYRAHFRWQLSDNGGLSWEDVPGSAISGASSSWTRYQLALPAKWLGKTVRLRAYTHSGQYGYAIDIALDKVSIDEQPANAVLQPLVPHLKSMDLAWDLSGSPNFKRYEIRRDINPNVDLSDLLVGSFTNITATNVTDVGLSIGQTYYYRLFVVNSNDTYSTGYEQFAQTIPIPISLIDPMENTDFWDATGNWGVDTLHQHDGSASLGDSPAAAYAVSQDAYILTAIDMRGSTWPVLRFWDRYQIAAGDSGFVEVSVNGTSWDRRYGVTEGNRTIWTQQTVDLSEWKNADNLRIRFRLTSDYNPATTADGWNIDDVEVVDYSPPAAVYPFFETYEGSASNWLNSTWVPTSDNPYEGSHAHLNKPSRTMIEYLSLMSTLGHEVDLTAAVAPQLTYWLRGQIDNYRAHFRWQVSDNDGLNWADVPGTVINGAPLSWTRYQVPLAPTWAGKKVRLRAYTHSGQYGYAIDITLDKVSIDEQPANAVLHPPVPHLKRIDLSWDVSGSGNFKRYEIRRDTSPVVDLNDILVGSFTDINVTNVTDEGLSIGQTYYYRLFVVNSNDTYSTGYEQFAQTVPIPIGLSDPMENTSNWFVTGSWGVDTLHQRGGIASLGDSPSESYVVSQDAYILTAIDMRGSTWPVLRFWDRYQIAAGDSGFVEVSVNGTSWDRRYAVTDGSRSTWAQQTVDLSEWKNADNLRIRFRLTSDYNPATTADGWNIDDVEVVDYSPPAAVYPFFETYEGSASNWLNSTWVPTSDNPHEGNQAHLNKPTRGMIEYLSLMSSLGHEIDLTGAVAPQLTYWLRGQIDNYRAHFRWQVSDNDGLNWADVPGTPISGASPSWTRYQSSLAPTWVGKTIRLRAYTHSGQYGYAIDITLDKVSIDEQPANAVLHPLVPHLKRIDLSWDVSGSGNFKRYEIRRDTSPVVDLNDILVGSFTDINVTNVTDEGLSIGQTYYYRLFVVNSNDTYATGYEQFAQTIPIPIGLSDPMENTSNWFVSGSWGIDTQHKHGGASSVGDSPGSAYDVSQDSYLLTAIDLSGSTWPVLRFWDRYQIAAGDSGFVEVSVNGTSWDRRYAVTDGSRSTWAMQTVDLSEWKNAGNLRIRFRLTSDYNLATTADGWNIDDVEVVDYSPPPAVYPFFETYESEPSNWLNSTWVPTSDNPYAGIKAHLNKPTRAMIEYLSLMSTLGRELDLTGAVAPQLTYWLRGQVDNYRAHFRWQLSENGGVSWEDVPGSAISAAPPSWTRYQIALPEKWIGKTVRLRAYTHSGQYAYAIDIALDNIGLGELAPEAPVPIAPQNGISVTSLRPTLTVRNAIDAQGDPLTYEFEVYTDAALSNRVANVPTLASQVDTTSWQVDLDLVDNLQYWWRCRAHDGALFGSWCTTETFFVNHINLPPNPVVLVSPPRAGIMHDLSYRLVWSPTEDPDLNDTIDAYHLQIADNQSFTTPVVNDNDIPPVTPVPEDERWVLAMPLSYFSGSSLLSSNTIYYWRMRARDPSGTWSTWSSDDWFFEYGTPPLYISPKLAPSGGLMLEWRRAGVEVGIEWTSTLNPPDWQPTGITTWENKVHIPASMIESNKVGFFRLTRN